MEYFSLHAPLLHTMYGSSASISPTAKDSILWHGLPASHQLQKAHLSTAAQLASIWFGGQRRIVWGSNTAATNWRTADDTEGFIKVKHLF
jgi:hypothetical protein